MAPLTARVRHLTGGGAGRPRFAWLSCVALIRILIPDLIPILLTPGHSPRDHDSTSSDALSTWRNVPREALGHARRTAMSSSSRILMSSSRSSGLTWRLAIRFVSM